MKKLLSVLVVVVMMLSLTVTAFAAEGLNANEEALLAKFSQAVDTYPGVDTAHAEQYKAEAKNALLKADLDEAACKDLGDTVDAVVAYMKEHNVTTKESAKTNAPAILEMVNKACSKYGYTVSLDDDLKATVTYKAPGADGSSTPDKVSDGGTSITKQTGMDMTATYAVAAVLCVSLVFGLAVVSKKNLLSNR